MLAGAQYWLCVLCNPFPLAGATPHFLNAAFWAAFSNFESFFMNNKLYVGNLAYAVRDNDLEQAFAEFGQVVSAKVMMERDTGRSKGFGFVEMSSDAEAQSAIEGLHEQPLAGRNLMVNIARPREERPAGGGFRGNNGGGFRGGREGGFGGGFGGGRDRY